MNTSNKDSAFEYRKWYLENKRKKYPKIIHPLFNIGTLLSLSLYSFLKIQSYEILFILYGVIFIVIGNLVVFLIHKYLLHLNIGPSNFPYEEHTLSHHKYFTEDAITFDSIEDWDTVFFPWFIIVGFIFLILPIFFVLGYVLGGVDSAFFFMGSASFYFGLYEIVHFSCHLKPDNPWLHIPGLRFMHEHHRIHHNPKLMGKYNFCIVHPLWDILLGTKYKN